VTVKVPQPIIFTLKCGAKQSRPSVGAGEDRTTRSPDAYCPPSSTVRLDGRAPMW